MTTYKKTWIKKLSIMVTLVVMNIVVISGSTFLIISVNNKIRQENKV